MRLRNLIGDKQPRKEIAMRYMRLFRIGDESVIAMIDRDSNDLPDVINGEIVLHYPHKMIPMATGGITMIPFIIGMEFDASITVSLHCCSHTAPNESSAEVYQEHIGNIDEMKRKQAMEAKDAEGGYLN